MLRVVLDTHVLVSCHEPSKCLAVAIRILSPESMKCHLEASVRHATK